MMNDVVRALLRLGMQGAAWLYGLQMKQRLRSFGREQQRLRLVYEVSADTPITGYDDDTRTRIEAFAARTSARLATTSGSTGKPKVIAYTRARVAASKALARSCGVRAFVRHRVRQPSLFILASLKEDDSYNALVLLQKRTLPSYLTGLVEPAACMRNTAWRALVDTHGATAVRVLLMTVSDPGLLYATNPSTLAVFFGELEAHWSKSTSVVRLLVAADASLHHPDIARALRRIAASGWQERIAAIAASARPLPIAAMFPSLAGYCCWDGGYVTSFLPQIRRALPVDRYVHIPMYSMSTETIETVTCFDDDGDAHFVPTAPGVLVEFLPEGAADDPALLVHPASTKAGKLYSLVVSDCYGLRRYQTEDLFACVGHVEGVPDLRFLRRRGLAYSFTGEKLTGEQVSAAFEHIRQRHPELAARGTQLACFPFQADPQSSPHYRLVVADAEGVTWAKDLQALAGDFDDAVADINSEWRDKRGSGRLGPTDACAIAYNTLAAQLDVRTGDAADVAARAWESQFKLVPLWRRTWQELGLPE